MIDQRKCSQCGNRAETVTAYNINAPMKRLYLCGDCWVNSPDEIKSPEISEA